MMTDQSDAEQRPASTFCIEEFPALLHRFSVGGIMAPQSIG